MVTSDLLDYINETSPETETILKQQEIENIPHKLTTASTLPQISKPTPPQVVYIEKETPKPFKLMAETLIGIIQDILEGKSLLDILTPDRKQGLVYFVCTILLIILVFKAFGKET